MPRKKLGRNIVKARQLRPEMSLTEALLWNLLRRAPGGIIVRRQHPIGPYVLDFYCASAKLAIEVDGMAHDVGDRPERDEARTVWLNAKGIEVLRIPAPDVLADPADVADALVRLCAHRAKPLHQPPAGLPPRAGEETGA